MTTGFAQHAIHHCKNCRAVVIRCRCPGPHEHVYDSACYDCRKIVFAPVTPWRPLVAPNPCIELGED